MNSEKLRGNFTKFIKGDRNSSWALLTFKPENGGKVIVLYARNNIPLLYVQYEITFRDNSKGVSANKMLESFIPIAVNKEIKWEEYFCKVSHIGKTTAQKINNKWSKEIFNLIKDVDTNQRELREILSDKQINAFVEYYKENTIQIESFLNLNSQDQINDQKFFYLYNMELFYQKVLALIQPSVPLLEYFKLKSPYVLYLIHEMDLKEVDRFALSLDTFYKNTQNQNSIQRFEAYVDFLLKDQENNNSTLINIVDIAKNISEILNLKKEEVIEKFKYLISRKKVYFRQIGDISYLTRNTTYENEKFIIEKLKEINAKDPMELNSNICEEFNILSNEQKNAFLNFLNFNISVVSGGPGTGKSYLIKFINKILKQNGLKNLRDYFIITPTGRASSSISLKINEQCRTIHSMLKIDKNERGIDDETLKNLAHVKVVIIDEFSMVNINIFSKLLYACSNLEKIILIGDVEQLPAIGPGNLLEEIIDFELANITYLEKNFRTEFKEIVEHFNAIKYNQLPVFKDKVVDLFQFNTNNYLDEITKLYLNEVKKYDLDNVILLTPSYKGGLGIVKLNNHIQKQLNDNGEIIYTIKKFDTEINFKINDRVIQLENRINDDVYNGDIGYIKKLLISPNKKVKFIVVEFKKNNNVINVKYSEEEFKKQINLAYAITIHKFQGSEIDSVIFAINPQYKFMITKKLVYTATSRAIKHLSIVTTPNCDYLELLTQNSSNKRTISTNFKYILQGE
ncbi:MULTISPECIES: ATP-dependent RecD-like DNA helicase [unclassified Mycoplasma]|uniref:ATP-dependent DNA helicase n=1 Tax=unclassified Mycoplasma TaxID=2683645 RepID=UPI00211C8221|nr:MULTISPECIES: AAA family ATPase [unclassified Mycoplasma]UUM19817.1 AAA family ATPase [Mycoplasma sp. 1578d]UUM24801.1 AAA family ATPase [Mycoplasma sp. 3686d]